MTFKFDASWNETLSVTLWEGLFVAKFTRARDRGIPIIITQIGAGNYFWSAFDIIIPIDEADTAVTPFDIFFG